jgi:DNA-binding LytR/AlgR family response regulator
MDLQSKIPENKTISVFVVEDEIESLRMMQDYVKRQGQLELAGHATNGEQALEAVKKNNYDLILIDLNLPGLNGMEVLRYIDTNMEKKPQIIITTAFIEHAVQGFEIGAIDYLPKPISFERFQKAIARVRQKISARLAYEGKLGVLNIKEKNQMHRVRFKDIRYLSSHGKHTIIHTTKRDYETASLLKDVLENISSVFFLRVHKQYVINLKYASHLRYDSGGRYVLSLRGDAETNLPVGARFSKELREKLNTMN